MGRFPVVAEQRTSPVEASNAVTVLIPPSNRSTAQTVPWTPDGPSCVRAASAVAAITATPSPASTKSRASLRIAVPPWVAGSAASSSRRVLARSWSQTLRLADPQLQYILATSCITAGDGTGGEAARFRRAGAARLVLGRGRRALRQPAGGLEAPGSARSGGREAARLAWPGRLAADAGRRAARRIRAARGGAARERKARAPCRRRGRHRHARARGVGDSRDVPAARGPARVPRPLPRGRARGRGLDVGRGTCPGSDSPGRGRGRRRAGAAGRAGERAAARRRGRAGRRRAARRAAIAAQGSRAPDVDLARGGVCDARRRRDRPLGDGPACRQDDRAPVVGGGEASRRERVRHCRRQPSRARRRARGVPLTPPAERFVSLLRERLAPSHVPAPNSNLPAAAAPLVGRARELAETTRLLRGGARLVTFTGAGGSGKTRLALETGTALVDDFPDGVYLVELAPVREPEGVEAAIAGVLLVGPDQLRDRLREARVLLVLDNFEHLLEAAPLVPSLLGEAPGLHVLATSRRPLHVAGEREYRVEPLQADAAAELFVSRARDVNPRFGDGDAVRRICDRLDRLPLALELAAARARGTTASRLASVLERQLPVLAGRRDAPARQRTLTAAIAWSYDLLARAQQDLLARLSVFRGGCTPEAAR